MSEGKQNSSPLDVAVKTDVSIKRNWNKLKTTAA